MTANADRLANQRAMDRAEYDHAVRIVRWLKERAQERFERGHFMRGQILVIAANRVADSFLLPLGDALEAAAPPAAPEAPEAPACTCRIWELFNGQVRLFESGDALHWDADEGRWERGWGRWGSVDMSDEDTVRDAEHEAAVEAYRTRPPTGATEPR